MIKKYCQGGKYFEKHSISYALLHTTNIYPTDNSLVRLGAMVELQMNFLMLLLVFQIIQLQIMLVLELLP